MTGGSLYLCASVSTFLSFRQAVWAGNAAGPPGTPWLPHETDEEQLEFR